MAVGGDDRNGEYMPVRDWWKPTPNHDSIWHWGDMGGVSALDPDRVFAVTWGDKNDGGELQTLTSDMVVVANRDGEIIDQWTRWDSILNWPHQVYVDPYAHSAEPRGGPRQSEPWALQLRAAGGPGVLPERRLPAG